MLVHNDCAGMIKEDEGYKKWRVCRQQNPMRVESVCAIHVDVVEYD